MLSDLPSQVCLCEPNLLTESVECTHNFIDLADLDARAFVLLPKTWVGQALSSPTLVIARVQDVVTSPLSFHLFSPLALTDRAQPA